MDNQQAKVEAMDMGWLIGFFEGEGTFCLRKQVYRKQKPTLRPEISVSSTDFELAERASRIIQGLGCSVHLRRVKHDKRGWKDQLVIGMVGLKRCKRLLDKIIPYMTESRKKCAAQTLQDFCDWRLSRPKGAPYGDREFRLGQRLRDLNGYRLRQSFRDSTRGVFDYDTKVESGTT
jgi:hypothetical protein